MRIWTWYVTARLDVLEQSMTDADWIIQGEDGETAIHDQANGAPKDHPVHQQHAAEVVMAH